MGGKGGERMERGKGGEGDGFPSFMCSANKREKSIPTMRKT